MDTDSANDTFLWSLTEVENDCSLCLRQIGISNNISGVVLPCCQQVVCEDCYKDELTNKSNGSCPFCFFKGNGKGQKSSISINNPGISMNSVINTVNSTSMTSTAIQNGSSPNANCLSSVGSGLPLDLSCWLPQNLTAICNPGYQSNSSSTCATSPYYKSNSTTAGEGFNQDNFIYMRGNSMPGVACGANPNNVGACAPNVSIQNPQQSPFGVLNDGFWNHTHSSVAIQNNTVNHNATGSSTNSSFISDPWMSTSGGYSPSNGFLHDFNSYDNNISSTNLNPNMNCSNTESVTDTNANISIIKQCNSGQNSKIMNNTVNGMGEVRNPIIDNDKVCDLINEGSNDSLYQSTISVNSFNPNTPSIVGISNSNTSDIYHNNSIYTWTVQSPMTCSNINSFNQVNNHNNMISSTTSVDVDFQRFCLGLGFDINSQNQVVNDPQNNGNMLINEHHIGTSVSDRNNRDLGEITLGHNQNIRPLDKSDSSSAREGDGVSVESGVNEAYVQGSNLTENKLESRDLQIGSSIDNHLITINEGGNSNNNNSVGDANNNAQLFNNSAFPPLTSALIKHIPSSRDSSKISNITNNTSNLSNNGPSIGNSQNSECLSSSNSPKLSGVSSSSSNQNINNNNPSTGSNPKLISMMGVRTEGSIRNNPNINIGSTISTNSSKQNANNSGKTTSSGGLNISTGNVSYIDAVLHKNDNGGGTITTSSSNGRSENQASVNSDASNISNDSSNNILTVNTDEDSSVAIGAHSEPYNYKRALCRHWMRGYCWLEADCKFAHGEAELRTRDGKLRHPTLSVGSTEVTNQNQCQSQPQTQSQSQFQSTAQPSTASVAMPPGNLTTTSTSSTFTSSANGGSTIPSSVQTKGLKQQSGNNRSTGNASYAATAASSLTSTVLSNDSNISYSVMVVSGASNLDSKR